MNANHSLLSRPLVVGLVLTLGLSSLLIPSGAEAQPAVTNTLEGLVGDEMGTPLANANVEAKNASGTKSATTDAKGNYKIEGLAPGQYTVTASKTGYESQAKTATLLAGSSQFLEFDLPFAGGLELTGVVKSMEDGSPIEGAYVRASSNPDDGSYRYSENVTGADGKYRVKVWGERAYVEVSREKFYSQYQELSLAENTTLDFSLQPIPKQTVRVVGDVKDAAGNPVQAMVNLRPDWDRQHHEGGGGGSNSTGVVSGGQNTSSNASCPPDADCAADMDYCCYYDPGPQNWNSTVTDENGHFEMMAYPGFVVVEANRRDYLVDSVKLELTEGETETTSFALEKAPERTVTFRGRIVDAESGDPLPGASVSLNNPEWADWNWFQSDADGNFEFQSRHGYTLLRAEATRYYYVAYAEDDVAVDEEGSTAPETAETSFSPPPEGQRDRDYFPFIKAYRTGEGDVVELTIRLQPKPGFDAEIVGYVVDPVTKTGIPNAQVSVSNQETYEWGQATTDEHGSYRIQVRSGFHVVSAYAEGRFQNETTLVVGKGDEARLDLFLTEGESRQMGYWSPDDYGYCRYDSACPVYADADTAESAPSTKGGGGSAGLTADEEAMDGDARSFAAGDDAGQRGGNSYVGSGGGLGPYSPAGGDDTRGAPGAGALLTLLGLVGAVAIVARRRRA